MSHIIELWSENVKRVKKVRVRPKPGDPLVIIGGRNAAGKSSVIDSVFYGLGGKSAICDEPIRRGEEKARVQITLDDMIVTRTFTKGGGGSLIITSLDGRAKYSKPQEMLNEILGRFSFDPLEVMRMAHRAQADAVRGLIGVDFSKLDEDRQAAYDERRYLNQRSTMIRAGAKALPFHPDAPAEPVDIQAITERLLAAQQANAAKDRAKDDAEVLARQVDSAREHLAQRIQDRDSEISRTNDEIERLLRQVEKLKAQAVTLADDRAKFITEQEKLIAEMDEKAKVAHDFAAGLPVIDLEPIKAEGRSAQAVNAQVKANAERQAEFDEAAKVEEQAKALTERIAKIDQEKASLLAEAKFPLAGLGFGETGLTYRDIPFGQASSAEQLRVCASIAMAMNPTLKVMFIRDGSLLDDDSMEVLRELATAYDYQVWIERVSEDGDGCTVVIEEGMVKEDESDAEEAKQA